MSEKIYCKNCIHFQEGERIPLDYGPPSTLRELCLSPKNFKDSHKDQNTTPISIPKIINKFNNCTWYEEETDSTSSSSSSSLIQDMP